MGKNFRYNSLKTSMVKSLANKLVLAGLAVFCALGPLAAQATVVVAAAKDFTTDNLQNIYALLPGNVLVKFSPDGQELFRYSDRTLGDMSFLDATNPFHLLVYLPDYQNVLTFDRTLSPSGQYNLNQLGFFRVSAVGMASDGLLWVYDEAAFRLKKITATGQPVVESSDLSLSLGQGIRPNFLIERNQQVFLNDPAVGVLVFDGFGQYRKTIPIPGLQELQVVGDELVYWQAGKLRSFHLTALLEREYALPPGIAADGKVRLGNTALFVLDKSGLKIIPIEN